jgi:hypothetical protein
MKQVLISFYCLIAFLITMHTYAQENVEAAKDAYHSINYDHFSKHLHYLASDALAGRDVASVGFDQAARYIAEELKHYGLIGFGDEGGYFQKVGFKKSKIDRKSVSMTVQTGLKTNPFVFSQDFTVLPDDEILKIDTVQNLVFVGYGHIIPEKNIDDYKGVDVKNKTVIAAIGSPESVQLTEEEDLFMKVENARKKGAVGIIIYFPKYALFQNKIMKQIQYVFDAFTLYYSDPEIEGEMFDFNIPIAIFAKLQRIEEVLEQNEIHLKKELKKMEKGEFVSRALESKMSIKYQVTQTFFDCKNVVGLLPGSDPILKNEYLVIGAHLDHLGIGKAVKGDSIYNGMWDNASGSAGLLSIAETFSSLPIKPKRSIVFVWFTGEEKGLLGSNYFASKNNISEGKPVACINIDMLSGLIETTDIIPLGYSHSTLSKAVDFAAGELHLKIDDNKEEERKYIERSDQMSFIKKGVPSLNLGQGYTAVNPKEDAGKTTDRWMKTLYHSPFDDLNQSYSQKAFLTFIQLYFLTTWFAADQPETITWNPESKFYKQYVLGVK